MGDNFTVKTHLAFHYDGKLLKLKTKVASIRPFLALEEANKKSFPQHNGEDKREDDMYVVVTESTVFHPQGGGQPSDEGELVGSTATMVVSAVRMDAVNDGQVLHLARPRESGHGLPVSPGDEIEMVVDKEKRLLYSRLHTAGHVLGSAVRHLLEKEIEGFDELKASHFPGSAACEFQGLIEGKWKTQIQERVDEYVGRAMPVEIDFWTENDFRSAGLDRLIPDRGLLAPGEDRFRVVRIVGAEVYPCGGTHVDSTDLCGATVVKKISRSKGVSRVSYSVA